MSLSITSSSEVVDSSQIDESLCQQAIDQIHEFVETIRNCIVFDVTEGSRSSRNRLAIQILRNLDNATESLFKSGGTSVDQTLEVLAELKDDAKKLIASSMAIAEDDKLDRVDPINAYLHQLIRNVKQIEKSWQFQYSLWKQKQSVAASLGCDVQQLTYGTSSLSIWLEVFRSNTVRNVIHSMQKRNLYVFGSSLGLIVFYWALYYPELMCVGYEVLPILHQTAVHLQAAYSIENCRFCNEDMLTADIGDAGIIVLTSMCWDMRTRKRVAQKISEETSPGCIVIDYQDSTFSIVNGLDSDGSFYGFYEQSRSDSDRSIKQRQRTFSVSDIVEGNVSWNNRQRLYLYK